ncbi:lysozyme [Chryseobacterium sp. H3056]|uniref:Lysozyme n=1 Tax=Kaistella daneshvariae TaxID=2487074 RepID=A0A3N0WXM0_9FLAO|nr:lysozyme [Kaistella daneshvariae]ROI09792.1 lysozyme [Kaistella daneshvariae]
MLLTQQCIALVGKWEEEKMFDLSGQNFLSDAEGVRYKAYKDSGGVWTVGRGITYYEDGSKVRPGDVISKQREQALFLKTVTKYANNVNKVVTKPLTQNQYNALVSFCYNIGITAFNKSTLLRVVNRNPSDPAIKAQFLRWVNDNGKKVPGLVNRRNKEIALYYK